MCCPGWSAQTTCHQLDLCKVELHYKCIAAVLHRPGAGVPSHCAAWYVSVMHRDGACEFDLLMLHKTLLLHAG
jgi:hypothetical protein